MTRLGSNGSSRREVEGPVRAGRLVLAPDFGGDGSRRRTATASGKRVILERRHVERDAPGGRGASDYLRGFAEVGEAAVSVEKRGRCGEGYPRIALPPTWGPDCVSVSGLGAEVDLGRRGAAEPLVRPAAGVVEEGALDVGLDVDCSCCRSDR